MSAPVYDLGPLWVNPLRWTRLRQQQMQILTVTFIAYACAYLLRKPISLGKSAMMQDLNVTAQHLGLIDTAFLLPYATFQMFLASLGDLYGAQKVIVLSIFGASAVCASLGSYNSITPMLVLLFANGAFQSVLWPNMIKAVGPWLDDSTRASLFGLWASSPFVGGALATYVAVWLLENKGWRGLFFLPSLIFAACAVLVNSTVRTPNELNMPTLAPAMVAGSPSRKNVAQHQGFTAALQVQGSLLMAACCFFVKVIRYALMMWLPLYATSSLGYDTAQAGTLSLMYDVGGALGAPFAIVLCEYSLGGLLIHGVAVYQVVGGVALAISVVVAGFGATGVGPYLMYVLIFVAGLCANSADLLISGPIATDLANYNGRDIQAAVAGFLNGVGSIGGVAQGLIVGTLSDMYGWLIVFNLIVVLSFASAAVVVPLLSLDKAMKAAKAHSPLP